MTNDVFNEIKDLITEAHNPVSADIDSKSTEDILKIMNSEDKKIADIVAEQIPYIAKGVDILVEAFKNNGKLIYVGAGTSGRLGVLDASECPPTFGSDPQMVQGLIAGGHEALVRAQEGAEDKSENGVKDLMSKNPTGKDVVCGIAASYRTPYVLGAIEKARKIGAKTLYITCNSRDKVDIDVDVAICPVVGAEVISGSTRMKAGTATKLVLNMLTTAAMIRCGKVYKNMMVDLMMTSRKLEERSKKTVMTVTGLSYQDAQKALEKAGGHVKTALVMILADVDKTEAAKRLAQAGGFVRKAIDKQRIS